MYRKINIAIIGAGGIGHVWATGIAGMSDIAVRTVVDTDKKKASELAEKFSDCVAESDWKQVVANPEIDAVLITVPHALLAPISLAALSAGKHVLCEKPSGVSSKEIEKNMRMAVKKKLVYMAGFNHRYHPAYMKAMEIFKKGGIGEANFVRARYGFGGRPGYGKEWRFNKKISGGGELLDQGMHMIDIARWFLGDFKQVHGFAENFFWGGNVEDNGFVLMRTPKGKVASLSVSWTNWEWVHSVEIFGTKGYLRIDGLDQRYNGPEQLVWGTRDKTFARPVEEKFVFAEEKKHDSMRREMEHFTKAIRSASVRKTIPSGADARAAISIVEKIYKNSHGTSQK